MIDTNNQDKHYSIEPGLSSLIEAMQKVDGYRAKSNELAKLLKISQKQLVHDLKRLETRGVVTQIKTKSKKASIWEVKPIYKQALIFNQSVLSNLNKDYISRKEFYSIIDSLYTTIHELNTQLILANQSLELIKAYWQRILPSEKDKVGTSFTKL